MDTEKIRTTEIEWVPCSPNINDVIHIAPKWLTPSRLDQIIERLQLETLEEYTSTMSEKYKSQLQKKHNQNINYE